MNQILSKANNFKKKINVEFSNKISSIPFEENKSPQDKKNIPKVKNKFKYKFQFIISSIAAIIFIFVFYINNYLNTKKEKMSKQLLNSFNLTTLYSEDNNYETEKLNNSVDKSSLFVIGMIKIDKINLNYPILSQSNKELLKMSLCRFAGPLPNEVGNLCIAGHNYVDYKLFSRLNELEKNDIVQIYDYTGNKLDYVVYDKYEVEVDDLSCTSQDVGGKRIITLLTCNNVNGTRIVVKAKEKGTI